MKTTMLLMFSLFLFTGSIIGQKSKFSFLDRDLKKDLNIPNRQSNFRQIDTTFKLIPNHYLFHNRNSQIFDLNPDRINQYQLEINHSKTYAYGEEFPGSSIYYAKRPSLLEMTNEKFFAIKPNTTAIYFLIINGHLSHRIK